jgi:hypothetical protein
MKLPPDDKAADVSPVAAALRLVQSLAEASALGLAADEQSLEDEESSAALQEAIALAERSARLRRAVERAASRSNESMDALRAAVCAFTVALRNEGIAPEGVLIRLKAAIWEQALSPVWTTSTWDGPGLRESITTWCIQDYFRSGDCTH